MRKSKDIILIFSKSIDGEKRDSLTIQIDDKVAFIPTEIITDFLKGESRNIKVTIPN